MMGIIGYWQMKAINKHIDRYLICFKDVYDFDELMRDFNDFVHGAIHKGNFGELFEYYCVKVKGAHSNIQGMRKEFARNIDVKANKLDRPDLFSHIQSVKQFLNELEPVLKKLSLNAKKEYEGYLKDSDIDKTRQALRRLKVHVNDAKEVIEKSGLI